MTTDLTVRVYGAPVPKGSRKIMPHSRSGKMISIAENARGLAAWSRAIAMTSLNIRQRPLWAGPVHCGLVFYVPPKGTRPTQPSASVHERHTMTPDLDKLTRAVWDALTGIVYVDDKQVCAGTIDKFYADKGEAPGVLITLRQL